ncbi:MAG: HlyD family secretion protein [Candidatus Sericytochromatia bacterium]
MKKQLIPVVLVLLSGGGWLGWQYLQPKATPPSLIASGTLESTPIELASRVGGRVTSLLVQEGQNVKPNQVLMRLEAHELEAQYRQVQAQAAAAAAQLSLLKAGSRTEDLQSAQAAWQAAELRAQQLANGSRLAEKERAAAEVEVRQSQLNLAEKEYNRLAKLVAAETAPQQKLDQAQQVLESARGGLHLAQKSQELVLEGVRSEEIAIAQAQARQQKALLSKVQRGVRPQEIQVAQAQLKQIQAQADQLRVRLQEASILSPCHCRLSIVGVEKGELVSAGAPVLTLLDPQDLWVKVYLSPLELKAIQLNQQVELQVDAWPDQRFQGQVVYISSQAEFTPRNIQTRAERIHQVFAIKIRIQTGKDKLFAGMPVDVIWKNG